MATLRIERASEMQYLVKRIFDDKHCWDVDALNEGLDTRAFRADPLRYCSEQLGHHPDDASYLVSQAADAFLPDLHEGIVTMLNQLLDSEFKAKVGTAIRKQRSRAKAQFNDNRQTSVGLDHSACEAFKKAYPSDMSNSDFMRVLLEALKFQNGWEDSDRHAKVKALWLMKKGEISEEACQFIRGGEGAFHPCGQVTAPEQEAL